MVAALLTQVVLVVSSTHWIAGWLVGGGHVMDTVGRDGGRVVIVVLGVTPVRRCKGVVSNGGYCPDYPPKGGSV